MIDKKLVSELKDIIVAQTDTAIPKFFANNALLAYEDEKIDATLTKRTVDAYVGVVQVIEKFMTQILLADMWVNNLCSAECVVHLPDKELKITVGINGNLEDERLKTNKQELVNTRLGIFDEFTWQMVNSIERDKNPLKLFFKHVEENLIFIKTKLELYGVDLTKCSINRELLEECHIQQPVEIHSLMNLYLGVSDFCNDNYLRKTNGGAMKW